MVYVVWAAQLSVAYTLFRTGLRKTTWPMEQLHQRIAWVEEYSPRFVRLIGACEIACSLGLVLPSFTGILPWLTPLTAVAIDILMILGAHLHLRRKEYLAALQHEPWIFMLATYIAWRRF